MLLKEDPPSPFGLWRMSPSQGKGTYYDGLIFVLLAIGPFVPAGAQTAEGDKKIKAASLGDQEIYLDDIDVGQNIIDVEPGERLQYNIRALRSTL